MAIRLIARTNTNQSVSNKVYCNYLALPLRITIISATIMDCRYLGDGSPDLVNYRQSKFR